MRRVEAPAKLTLSLRVLGTRADGYHELDAIVVPVTAPRDTLAIDERDDREVRLRVTGSDAAVPSDERNLVTRALRRAGRGADVVLHKVIPPGSGLGGGSSDAAAVLRAIGVDDLELAADVGSDVPACLVGRAVRVRGRGERVDPVTLGGALAVVVAVPPFAVATVAVYQAWDELGGPRASRELAPPPALDGIVDALVNDLEVAAARVEPRLRDFARELESVLGTSVLLAGSGSACWAVVADPDAARAGADRVGRQLGARAFAALDTTSPARAAAFPSEPVANGPVA